MDQSFSRCSRGIELAGADMPFPVNGFSRLLEGLMPRGPCDQCNTSAARATRGNGCTSGKL